MKKVILITGGARSGKSRYAEELALSLSKNPVYVATAHVWDEEFRERVKKHQERRGPEWTNIEEEMLLSRHDLTGRVAVIDCITLWCTNYFYPLYSSPSEGEAGGGVEVDTALEALKVRAGNLSFVIVTTTSLNFSVNFNFPVSTSA